jgi:epoxyqueuosine reductase
MQLIDNSTDTGHESLSKTDLSRAIKQRAYAQGFDKVGLVKAEPLSHESQLLKEWLSRGYQGTMQWMLREPAKRANPLELFPDAKSIIVVAENYYTPHEHSDSSATGKISRYAWGDDYHDVMGEKLHSLLTWIESVRPDAKGKVCVDIQPVMDKAWAVRAGLGWLGKHTNVITPEFGSWIFIGEILLNLELEFEGALIEDHCGTCTLCIDACPTQAITEPYVLDSNKCISYATIELRSESIPVEISSNLSGWLYGCDICQDVCPWNRFQQTSSESRFEPRPGNVNSNLAEIIDLEPSVYAQQYRSSAMKRAKLTGLQRNARALLARKSNDNPDPGDP